MKEILSVTSDHRIVRISLEKGQILSEIVRIFMICLSFTIILASCS